MRNLEDAVLSEIQRVQTEIYDYREAGRTDRPFAVMDANLCILGTIAAVGQKYLPGIVQGFVFLQDFTLQRPCHAE